MNSKAGELDEIIYKKRDAENLSIVLKRAKALGN